MVAASLFDLLKPFLWLGLAAFLTGFGSYLALGGQGLAPSCGRAAPASAPVAAPASGDWSLPRRI